MRCAHAVRCVNFFSIGICRLTLNYSCAHWCACGDCSGRMVKHAAFLFIKSLMEHVPASAGSAGFQPCWAGAKIVCHIFVELQHRPCGRCLMQNALHFAHRSTSAHFLRENAHGRGFMWTKEQLQTYGNMVCCYAIQWMAGLGFAKPRGKQRNAPGRRRQPLIRGFGRAQRCAATPRIKTF